MKCGSLSVIEGDGRITVKITSVEDFCLVLNFYANEKYN
jgi:hypothetical protein